MKAISKKHVIMALLFYGMGLLTIFSGVLVLIWLGYSQSYLRIIVVLSGFAFLTSGYFIMCRKCKCPYCDYGGKGSKLFESEYYRRLSLKSIKRGKLTCPRCENIIEIK